MFRPRLKVTGTVLCRFSNSPITRINGGLNAGAYRHLSLSGMTMKPNTLVSTQDTHSIDAHIGSRLRARRELRRLPLAMLASLMGIDLTELRAIEGGRAEALPKSLLLAANALNVHPRYFFLDFHPREIAA